MKKIKKTGWLYMPQQTDMEWIGQWLVLSLAFEFHKKNKRWPVKLKRSSVRVKGRVISVEME